MNGKNSTTIYHIFLKTLDHKKKFELIWLIFLINFGLLLEGLTIVSALPVLQFLLRGTSDGIDTIFGVFEIPESINTLDMLIFFCVLILFSTYFKIVIQKKISFWAYGACQKIGSHLLDSYVLKQYAEQKESSKDNYISTLSFKLNILAGSVIMPGLQMLAAMAPVFGILIAFIFLSPTLTISGIIFLSCIYSFIFYISRRQLKHNSEKISIGSSQSLRYLSLLFERPRQVILEGETQNLLNNFCKSDFETKQAMASNILVSQLPRFSIEGIVIVVLAICAYLLLDPTNSQDQLAIAGTFLLGMQKVLPMVQRLYIGWAAIQGNKGILSDIIELLEETVGRGIAIGKANMAAACSSIELKDVVVGFPNSMRLLKVSQVKFSKDMVTVIRGPSGRGKTFMIETVLGLREPVSGTIMFEGQPITSSFCLSGSYYCANDEPIGELSVAEFLGLGSQENVESVERILIDIGLSELLGRENWVELQIGERAGQLSLGQRQRLKIVKGLLGAYDILIFDEPTSNVEASLENKIIDLIVRELKNKIVIVISHSNAWCRDDFQIFEI